MALVLPPSSEGSQVPPPGCSFSNRTLTLNGELVPFIHFGALDEIWMPAKPVMRATGEANITHILERVFPDDQMTFGSLVASKGLPMEGCYGFRQAPDPSNYHEKKAIWVNESGFYAMVLGSRKPHCAAFQRWVLHEVLPSIRRTGSYQGPPPGSLPVRSVTQGRSGATPEVLPACTDLPARGVRRGRAESIDESREEVARRTRQKRLPEPCVSWASLGVAPAELPGVKKQFEAFLHMEADYRGLGRSFSHWVKAPPERLRALAQASVEAYRTLNKRMYAPIAAPDGETGSSTASNSSALSESEASDSADVLKLSRVMRAAGVWAPVRKAYNVDLSIQMHSLKCAETDGGFSEKRDEMLQGRPVQVHRYLKSTDIPLAWKALEDTRFAYERRVRDLLTEAFELAGHSDDALAARLARGIAEELLVRPEL
jgi:hypothetical protein